MNLHFTPSFNIDRLCKTASVLLFLVLKAPSNQSGVLTTFQQLSKKLQIAEMRAEQSPATLWIAVETL